MRSAVTSMSLGCPVALYYDREQHGGILGFELSTLVNISISYGVLHQINLQNDERRGRSSKAVDQNLSLQTLLMTEGGCISLKVFKIFRSISFCNGISGNFG